jgi:hypothetical protein
MCNIVAGAVVPMPTLPDVCWTTNWDVPTVKPPVENVEVAVVDWTVSVLVAVKVDAVNPSLNHPPPATLNFLKGVVVPIPTFPPVVAR